MTDSEPRAAVSVTMAELLSQSGLQSQGFSIPLSSRNVEKPQLSVGLVTMPPGGQAKCHVHNRYDVMIVLLEGHAAALLGDDLEPVVAGPGDFLYIPSGVPHTAVNISTEHRAVVLESRADPEFNADVELLEHLEAAVPAIAQRLREEYAENHRYGVITDLV